MLTVLRWENGSAREIVSPVPQRDLELRGEFFGKTTNHQMRQACRGNIGNRSSRRPNCRRSAAAKDFPLEERFSSGCSSSPSMFSFLLSSAAIGSSVGEGSLPGNSLCVGSPL